MKTAANFTAAVAMLSLCSVSALAIDASCVGVQAVATRQLITQLAAPEQARFAPVAQRVDQLEREVTQVLAAPEQALHAVQSGIAQRMPGTTPEQRQQAFFNEVLTTPATDRASQQATAAQVAAHVIEGRLMVAASLVPREGHQARMEGLVRRYAADQSPELTRAAGADGAVQQAYGVAAVSRALRGRSMLESHSQTLASDGAQLALASELLRIGFDDAGIRAGPDVVDARDLPRMIPVAQAQGARSMLVIDHIVRESAPAEVRRRITAPGATATGRTQNAEVAKAINGIVRADRILQIAELSAPLEPPPDSPNSPARRQWAVEAVTRQEQAASHIREDGDPILLEEAGVDTD